MSMTAEILQCRSGYVFTAAAETDDESLHATVQYRHIEQLVKVD